MLLCNFYEALRHQLSYESWIAKTYNGTTRTVHASNNASVVGFVVSACTKVHTGLTGDMAQHGVLFGDGDTPPTFNDVALSGNILNTKLTGSVIRTYEHGDNGSSYTFVYTLTNTSSESITIKEVAAHEGFTSSAVERTLLEAPITIAPGGVGQVTYTIRFNYPTA